MVIGIVIVIVESHRIVSRLLSSVFKFGQNGLTVKSVINKYNYFENGILQKLEKNIYVYTHIHTYVHTKILNNKNLILFNNNKKGTRWWFTKSRDFVRWFTDIGKTSNRNLWCSDSWANRISRPRSCRSLEWYIRKSAESMYTLPACCRTLAQISQRLSSSQGIHWTTNGYGEDLQTTHGINATCQGKSKQNNFQNELYFNFNSDICTFFMCSALVWFGVAWVLPYQPASHHSKPSRTVEKWLIVVLFNL